MACQLAQARLAGVEAGIKVRFHLFDFRSQIAGILGGERPLATGFSLPFRDLESRPKVLAASDIG